MREEDRWLGLKMVATFLFGALLIGLLGFVLSGCVETVLGPPQTEKATVVETHFLPGQSGTATGISTGGHLVVSDVSTSPVWAVVFECPHGKFAIQGSNERARRLWQRFKVGDPVEVTYMERFEQEDHRPETRHLVGIKFIDATPDPFARLAKP